MELAATVLFTRACTCGIIESVEKQETAVKTYQVKYYGHSFIVPLERELRFIKDEYATERVKQDLPQYFPTYTSAALWEVHGETYRLVAEFSCKVVVTAELRS